MRSCFFISELMPGCRCTISDLGKLAIKQLDATVANLARGIIAPQTLSYYRAVAIANFISPFGMFDTLFTVIS